MRRTMLVLTVILCAPTAVMAWTAPRPVLGDGVLGPAGAPAGSAYDGALQGHVILVKGDKSGTGPGAGGHKGAKKGEKKGGQQHGQDQGKGSDQGKGKK